MTRAPNIIPEKQSRTLRDGFELLFAPRKLAADTRGAIFVLGIVFGMILFGALWNLASIGDGAIWRERSQDVADAAAFHSAALHARGMNIIAMINLVMAVLMAMYIIFKIVLLATGIACLAPPWVMCSVFSTLLSWDTRLADALATAERGLMMAEAAVATAAPILANGHAMVTTLNNYPEADLVLSISSSLLPTGGWPGRLEEEESPDSGGTRKKGFTGIGNRERLGIGVSLPVQGDHYNVLCERSGETLEWVVGSVIPLPSWVFKFGGTLTGNMPWLFCKGWLSWIPGAKGKGLDLGDVKVAKPWEPFQNGNLLGQTWAVVSIERRNLEQNDRGLEIADSHQTGNLDALEQPWWNQTLAQGEYYSDCDGGWADCRQMAMWTLNWRARLRRVHALESLGPLVGRVVSILGPFTIYNHLNKVIPEIFVRTDLGREVRNTIAEGIDRHVNKHFGIADGLSTWLNQTREIIIH